MDDVRKWKFPKAGVEAARNNGSAIVRSEGNGSETVVQWERKVRSAQEGETPGRRPRVPPLGAHFHGGRIHPNGLCHRCPLPFKPSTTKSSTVHLAKPKTEEVLDRRQDKPLRGYQRKSSLLCQKQFMKSMKIPS